MRELRHDNLVPFLGACVESGHICILTPFCSRGSLEDVLDNEDYRLDNMFIASLVADLIKVNPIIRFHFKMLNISSRPEISINLKKYFCSFLTNFLFLLLFFI